MKVWTIAFVLASLMLSVPLTTQADWTGAASIRQETFYVPSSDLTLGACTTVQPGTNYELTGYGIADPFQINLEYQAGILDADIANINTYLYPADAAFPPGHTDGTWSLNFSDNDEYVMNVNPAGGLTIYEYDGLQETYDASIQWTLSAWHQTILAGDIVDNGNGTITLRVLPEGTYRPFVGDPPVNNVEIFDGNLDTEVLGYVFTGTACEIGCGSTLTPLLVPEPMTLVLLASGLLALGGLALLRRKQ
ncbi:MAG: PEP-CTERM sorting domain-containing protein [Pirellulales bacterium]|nr:PEP-CTERM sorting domain-containing protein [Pirellulales bacterium]